MTELANAPVSESYAEQRARDWAAFSASSAPLPSYRDHWEEYSHGWKVPIEFLQPIGLDRPDILEPIQPLVETLSKMEEVELFPTGFLRMTTVHVGFLMATDIMWSQVESLWANAAPRIHRFEPFDLRFGGISAFEDSLYVGIDDAGILKQVRNQVRLAIPVIYQKAKEDPHWDEYIPFMRFAGFTGKGSRERVVEAVAPYLEAQLGDTRIDQVKMGRVPADPQTGWGDIDVIAEIPLYGKDARKGYHN